MQFIFACLERKTMKIYSKISISVQDTGNEIDLNISGLFLLTWRPRKNCFHKKFDFQSFSLGFLEPFFFADVTLFFVVNLKAWRWHFCVDRSCQTIVDRRHVFFSLFLFIQKIIGFLTFFTWKLHVFGQILNTFQSKNQVSIWILSIFSLCYTFFQ